MRGEKKFWGNLLGLVVAVMVSGLVFSFCLRAKENHEVAEKEKGQEKNSAGRLPAPAQPLHAVQFLHLEAKNWAEVETILSELQAAKVQAVIFRVFQNPRDRFYDFVSPQATAGVYYQTSAAPVVADALGTFCDLAHKHSLQVFAWMTSRYANYGQDNPALTCMAWDFEVGDARPSKGFSPLLPEVQDHLVQLYSDLGRYPIDGVLIQDDLILKFNEDLGPRAREFYRQATGREADPAQFFRSVKKMGGGKWVATEYSPEFWEWRRWENAELIKLALRLRQAVQGQRPGIPVGMNLYYETLTAPENALAWYAQDLTSTLSSDLDFYSLMLYHRQMEKELNLPRARVINIIEESLSEVVKKVEAPPRIWVKFQAVDWDTKESVPRLELEEIIRRVKRLGPLSLVVVLSGNREELAVIK